MLEIFGISFLMALTGALQPGPLLTFTVISTIKNKTKKAWLTGALIVLGHAILEISLILAILLGISVFLSNLIVIRIIGIVGGGMLVYFGITTFLQLRKGVDINFEEIISSTITETNVNEQTEQVTVSKKRSLFNINPVLGGVLISLTNPYWILWWVFVGLSVMVSYSISFASPLGIAAFFIGHILADLIWYLFISTIISMGSKKLNAKIYWVIMLFCAVFMTGFGIYIAVNIFTYTGSL